MGRVSGAPQALAIQLGNEPTTQPDGAATTFSLPSGQVAVAGSLAAYRKAAAVAAPAAYAGVDVAAAGPAQVALLSELNDLRAVVESLRAILNRSYMRDDPTLWGFGEDLALGIVPTVENGTIANLANVSDNNASTYAGGTNTSEGRVVFDLGSPKAIRRVQARVAIWSGATSGVTYSVPILGKLAAADPWQTIATATGWASDNSLDTFTVPNAGPWRFVAFEYEGRALRYHQLSVIGGEDITNLTYDAAPPAGERLLLDYSRED